MVTVDDVRAVASQLRLAALEHREMRELVLDAWALAVPKRVAAEYFAGG